jgi:hypothetical protein
MLMECQETPNKRVVATATVVAVVAAVVVVAPIAVVVMS